MLAPTPHVRRPEKETAWTVRPVVVPAAVVLVPDYVPLAVSLPEPIRSHTRVLSDNLLGPVNSSKRLPRGDAAPAGVSCHWPWIRSPHCQCPGVPKQGGPCDPSPRPHLLTRQLLRRPRRSSEQGHRPSIQTTHLLQPPQTLSFHSAGSAV